MYGEATTQSCYQTLCSSKLKKIKLLEVEGARAPQLAMLMVTQQQDYYCVKLTEGDPSGCLAIHNNDTVHGGRPSVRKNLLYFDEQKCQG